MGKTNPSFYCQSISLCFVEILHESYEHKQLFLYVWIMKFSCSTFLILYHPILMSISGTVWEFSVLSKEPLIFQMEDKHSTYLSYHWALTCGQTTDGQMLSCSEMKFSLYHTVPHFYSTCVCACFCVCVCDCVNWGSNVRLYQLKDSHSTGWAMRPHEYYSYLKYLIQRRSWKRWKNNG